MNAVRVTKQWQRAAVYYVRARAMCDGFGCSFEAEFHDDTTDSDYVLVLDGERPVSACRVHWLGGEDAKIERVATLSEYRGKHFGSCGISEAERWAKEKGVKRIFINSREAALGFYQKLGYTPDYSERSGSGDFRCVMTEKFL